MPVSSNFSLDSYNSSGRESRGRRSSESSTASDATRERLRLDEMVRREAAVSGDATEHIPTRRAGVGPKPATNPMKFVAAGPAPLLRTASEQMLKAEKLRLAAKPAVKEEESAAWQNNLDSWKSNRRKRQEDVIERLTEVKKLEEQENGRGSARRNKTFGEMMQERAGDRRGRRVLQVFTDDDNDISSLLSAKSPASSDTRSDLGFATSSDTGSEPSDHQDIHISSSSSRQQKPAVAPGPPPPVPAQRAAPEPAVEPPSLAPPVAPAEPPLPAPAMAPAEPTVAAEEPVQAPAGAAASPEPPSSAAELGGWQDPAAVADQMEAQILRQLEESERSQLAPVEEPVVLDFPLQPSNAAPPSEKPPPPPPASDDDDEPVIRAPKSTTDVKKNLYRRRSDFLGIQGQEEAELAAVARPPDMEALLRQERAMQQQQERRWQQQQSREESLRRAEEEAEQRAEEFRRRAVIEKEQRDRERRAVEQQLEEQEREERERRAQEHALQQERRAQEQQMERERRAQEQFEMDRRAKEQQLIEQERRQKDQQLMEQERRVQEQQILEQERRAQEQQLLEQDRRAQEQKLEQERRMQEQQLMEQERREQEQEGAADARWDADQQEREWRRRKELLSADADADRQERQIMESLEQEESWRHQQHAKYQSRLARLAAAEQTWQRTQEAPAGPAPGADLLSSRQQARSNPNLLEEAAAGSLLTASRSYGDLAGPPAPAAAVPLQQSRSHGRLYQPAPAQQQPQQQQQQPQQPQRHQRSVPNHVQPPPGPAKPHRTAEQDGRIPWTTPALAPQPAPAASPPGPMSRHTLTALAAAPRPALRQEWVPRKRADAPRNTGQHWLIQEAEHRRISAQQERTSRQQQQQQQQQQQGGGYTAPRAPPPVQQKHPSPPQQQFTQPPPVALPSQQQQHQYPAYYSHQPIYENTPAQLLNANANNNYQDINSVSRLGYGTPVYQSSEVSPPRPEPASPAGQSPEDRVLSVSGRKKCSHCGEELGRGAAMIIESLRLFYHISCFKCCVCNVQLGNGSMGADVRVRNNKLHCHDCYSNDEGLKFSKV